MIINTFTKRMALARKGDRQDVYKYDEVPEPLRVQIVHVLQDAIGTYVRPDRLTWEDLPASNSSWEFLHNQMSREMGQFALSDRRDIHKNCVDFIMTAHYEQMLSFLEMALKLAEKVQAGLPAFRREQSDIRVSAEEAIEELNARFMEHCIGYEYCGGIITRKDNEYLHREVVREAIRLLHQHNFAGANAEFLEAHRFLRERKFKNAVQEALKAFESAMRSICKRRAINVDSKATARTLIAAIFDAGIIPEYLQAHFTSLRTTLEAGLPTARNRTSGHGQGVEVTEIPDYFTSYCLNLAATNIVFLVSAVESETGGKRKISRALAGNKN